jgi:soluble lytic murein transglycosylase-like protein
VRRAPPPEYEAHLREAAERYNLPYALLAAVMLVESNSDPRAVSHKGAIGLMQLMPRTSQEMYVADALDPKANIEGGARYLRVLANRYQGDLTKTLAAYNAGPEAVRKAGEQVPNYPETREYVRRVLEHYNRLKGQGDRG